MPVVGAAQAKPMDQGDERGECIETKRGDYETLETERSSTPREAKQKWKSVFPNTKQKASL